MSVSTPLGTPRRVTVKTIALVAHDGKKPEMAVWARQHAAALCKYNLVCTGTTGKLVAQALAEGNPEGKGPLTLTRLKSGPLGGDQQMGAYIAENKVDLLVFLWDPMEAQPHDVDVKALLRIASVYNIPTACNISTAEFIMASPLLDQGYTLYEEDYSGYLGRFNKP